MSFGSPRHGRDDFRSRLADQQAALKKTRELVASRRAQSPSTETALPEASPHTATTSSPLSQPADTLVDQIIFDQMNSTEGSTASQDIPEVVATTSIVPRLRITLKRIKQIKTTASQQELVTIPHILQVLTSLSLATSECRPICVVLPSTRGILQALGILSSIECLAADFDEMSASYIARILIKGKAFRNISDGKIYQFDSITNYNGQRLIRFAALGSGKSTKDALVNFPESKALKFEPTTRKQASQRTGAKNGASSLTSVDLLAGVSTFGNTGLIRNCVILVGRQTEFDRYLEQVCITTNNDAREPIAGLSNMFPRGGFDGLGGPVVRHPVGCAGDPMVAVSPDMMTLERASLDENVEAQTQIVLTDRIDAVLENLDLAGRVGERQRLVLLADAGVREKAATLRDHGWIVWEPAPNELLPVSGQVSSDIGIPGVERIQHAAIAENSKVIGWMDIKCASLGEARSPLELLYGHLRHESVIDNQELQILYKTANGLFFDAISWLRYPGRDYNDQYDQVRKLIEQGREVLAWSLGQEAAKSLDLFMGSIDAHYSSLKSGSPSPKGEFLLKQARNATKATNFEQVFLTGSRASRDDADLFLRDNGLEIRCRPVERLRDWNTSPSAVAFSVMRREHFNYLVDPWPTRHLIFMGYEFETEIYRRRLDIRNRLRSQLSLSREDRQRVTAVDDELFGGEKAQATTGSAYKTFSSAPDMSDTLERITWQSDWRWAHRIDVPLAKQGDNPREARIVKFIGRSWMATTEDQRLLHLAESTSRSLKGGSSSTIETLTTADLNPSMRLIVREAGERDIIRTLAEKRVGISKYAKLLQSASTWRIALRSSKLNAEAISRRLEVSGIRRHSATIRSWLINDELIGPRTEDDVVAISRAFPLSGKDDSDWNDCWRAIEEIRSLHISAGSQLTELIQQKCGDILLDPSDRETAVDLGIGVIWIVEVGEVSVVPQWVPLSYCNKLHWEPGIWREALFKHRVRLNL